MGLFESGIVDEGPVKTFPGPKSPVPGLCYTPNPQFG